VCASRPDGLVDVNVASVEELMRVPGMTKVWAARIVRFRPYRSKLDLLNEGVVTPEAYRRIRDGIVAHRAAK
jgi:DNA uptake protein ComE-like DNA-binding protein